MAEARTLLLTRPRAQSEDFAGELDRRLPGRFRIVVAPLIAIVPVPGEIDLSGVQGLVFTSANGVAQFAARTAERGLPAWCVGAMTAAAAREAGFAARDAGGDVVGLARLVAAGYRPGAGALLHVRGRHAAGDLVGMLAAEGVPSRAAEIYDQAACDLPPDARALLAEGRVDLVALFSARSAQLFAAAARDAGWNLAAVTTVALSRAVDAALDGLGQARRLTAPEPTRDGMLAALAAA
jgi:uroporphyrinogen-III synthase